MREEPVERPLDAEAIGVGPNPEDAEMMGERL